VSEVDLVPEEAADLERLIIAAFSTPGPIIGHARPELERVRRARELRSLGYFDTPEGHLDRRAYASALGVCEDGKD
jgi:hypothetical protein